MFKTPPKSQRCPLGVEDLVGCNVFLHFRSSERSDRHIDVYSRRSEHSDRRGDVYLRHTRDLQCMIWLLSMVKKELSCMQLGNYMPQT